MQSLDRIILGGNPLSGVDHFLPERARMRVGSITDEMAASIIVQSSKAGAQGFNFGVTNGMIAILRKLNERKLDCPLGLYPIIPDTQRYVSTQLRRGTIGLISEVMGSMGIGAAGALLRGGLSLSRLDPLKAMTVLIDLEVSKVLKVVSSMAKIKALFLHEAITDLAVAYQAEGVLQAYADYVTKKYDFLPGFVTRNFPAFIDASSRLSLNHDKFVVMSPFNSMGFQMTPSREQCESSLREHSDYNVIAMSVLAGGQLGVQEAIRYLKYLKPKSVCVGVSASAHAIETFQMLKNELA